MLNQLNSRRTLCLVGVLVLVTLPINTGETVPLDRQSPGANSPAAQSLQLAPLEATATVIRVPTDFTTIQAALDAAVPGDTVLVAGGTYTGAGNKNLTFGGKDIVLKSETGLFGTTIDCQDNGRAIHLSSGETSAAVIDGFLLRDGDTGPPNTFGGGVLLDGSSPTIKNCYIFNNTSGSGGGLACLNGSFPVLQNTTVASNSSTKEGGGVTVDNTSSVTVTNSLVQNNISGNSGGGFYFDGGSGSLISGCTIVKNTSSGSGGGIACENGASPDISVSHIQGNQASAAGGGVSVDATSTPSLSGIVVAGNAAGTDGGGLSTQSILSIASCTFADNNADLLGGGVFIDVGGIVSPDQSILWDNCSGSGGDQAWVASGSTLDISCGLVDVAGLSGPGSVNLDGNTTSADPAFCLPACCALAPIYDINGLIAAAYTLEPTSPALAANSLCGLLIGAEGEGCPAPTSFSGAVQLSRVPVSAFECGVHANEVWGYASPSGREYAILGLAVGTGFVEVTDPINPTVIAVLPDAISLWSDMATYDEYAYNVNENGAAGDGVQIFDLRQIDAGIVTHVGNFTDSGFTDAHNIVTNEDSGFAYLCVPHILSADLVALDLADPEDPVIAGTWNDGTGAQVHDAHVVSYTSGPYAGKEIAFLACEGAGVNIVDVTNKGSMTTLSTFAYPNVTYCHQCWLSEDKKYLFVNDELDETQAPAVTTTTTYVIDVQDLANPFLHSTFTTGLPSIDHNLVVRGNTVYEANYTSGARIFDITDINSITEIAYYDTHPENDGQTYDGAWGIYPLLPSGKVLVSDLTRGLFVLEIPSVIGVTEAPPVTVGFRSHPNPFSPRTTYSFYLPTAARTTLRIYDLSGRLVQTLLDEELQPGPHQRSWNGTDRGGSRLSNGVYLIELNVAGKTFTQKSILLR